MQLSKRFRKPTKKEMKQQMRLTPAYIIMISFVVFMAWLLGWVLIASLSNTRSIFSGNLLSEGLTLDNFRLILQSTGGLKTLYNTLIYTVPTSILLILICAPAAYALSRFDFPGNKLSQQLIVTALTIPGIMITMPLYYHLSSMGIMHSRFIIVLLFTTNSIPYNTYFLMGFYKNISTSYEESASIDGASVLRTFWEVIFPMSKPAVVTLTIFNLIGKWNSYLLPLIFANTPEMRPVAVWMTQTIDGMIATGNYAGMFATVVVGAAPTIILYMFLSRYITGGTGEGGVKG